MRGKISRICIISQILHGVAFRADDRDARVPFWLPPVSTAAGAAALLLGVALACRVTPPTLPPVWGWLSFYEWLFVGWFSAWALSLEVLFRVAGGGRCSQASKARSSSSHSILPSLILVTLC